MTIDEIKAMAASGADMPAVLAGLSAYLEQLGDELVAAGEAIREAGADPSVDSAPAIAVQIAAARRMLENANIDAGEALDVALYVGGVAGG